jgi:hypothetical protein
MDGGRQTRMEDRPSQTPDAHCAGLVCRGDVASDGSDARAADVRIVATDAAATKAARASQEVDRRSSTSAAATAAAAAAAAAAPAGGSGQPSRHGDAQGTTPASDERRGVRSRRGWYRATEKARGGGLGFVHVGGSGSNASGSLGFRV